MPGTTDTTEGTHRPGNTFDVDRTARRYFREYDAQHRNLQTSIDGIDDERDRRWYASVILNRLMFIWFLQKKRFLDDGNVDYLPHRLAASKQHGPDRFFAEFLKALFFEAFARPESDRSTAVKALTGQVPYLGGSLFLHHALELDECRQPRIGRTLKINDRAFDGIFALFGRYTWHLDDTPRGDADEINPDVLGHVFEKFINQKAFGAYYTRPEITAYLADRSIRAVVLDKIDPPSPAEPRSGVVAVESISDRLAKMDADTVLRLVNDVLPTISVLDPAVGSGAFLIAALRSLITIYDAVVSRAEHDTSAELQHWLAQIRREHPSIGYGIRKRIVTDNLYGVDLMEEACEIAKLRLFLAMTASIRTVEELEPLPNIDFNIVPGNSLIGLMHVNAHERDCRMDDTLKPRVRELHEEGNREPSRCRNAIERADETMAARAQRDSLDTMMQHATVVMNERLRDRFDDAGVRFEEATWDTQKNSPGKPRKRRITRADIDALHPLHWGQVFAEVMEQRGGFDIILTNPPWDVFKPQAKEFFAEHSELVTKNTMTLEAFETERSRLLDNEAVRTAWLAYGNRFPHVSAWFRAAPEYAHQSAMVNGRKTGSDLNLYKLFVERCFHLLRDRGHCGIVIPSGLYTDLGATGLRNLLFTQTRIHGLFGFENRKALFEGVHRSFKFVVLTFEKAAGVQERPPNSADADATPDESRAIGTQRFPATFMRLDAADLGRFPDEGALWLDVDFIRRLSPGSHSLMEFKSERDIAIMQKLLGHPLLGDRVEDAWNVAFTAEFHMTNDNHLFKKHTGEGRRPLYEGKMIWQFDAQYEKPRYWVDEKDGRAALVGQGEDRDQCLDYQTYRLGFRDIASNTNERTLVACMIPPAFHGNKLPTVRVFDQNGTRQIDAPTQLVLCALLNSFVLDWVIRLKVTTTLNFFYVHQLPVPRLTPDDPSFAPLLHRAAKLICTTAEFDGLAREAGLRDHRDGATDPAERARLRAEIDGLVAHRYGLSDEEFLYILSSFPLVPERGKAMAYEACREVSRGLIA